MPKKSNNNYGLYQTLISSEKDLPLSEEEQKNLMERIKNSSYETREAIFMIICEHAKIHEEFNYDPENISLPYEIKTGRNKVTIDLKNIPVELQRILLRFSNVFSEKK